MAARKISELTEKTELEKDDEFLIVDSSDGENKKVSSETVKNFVDPLILSLIYN